MQVHENWLKSNWNANENNKVFGNKTHKIILKSYYTLIMTFNGHSNMYTVLIIRRGDQLGGCG